MPILPAFAAAAHLMAASPAALLEYHLVQWKKTQQCEIVTHLPLFGDHWTEMGVYDTRVKAEHALAYNLRYRLCPPPKTPRGNG